MKSEDKKAGDRRLQEAQRVPPASSRFAARLRIRSGWVKRSTSTRFKIASGSRCAFGTHSTRDLQSAWTSHGADTFTFEPLEQLEDEEIPYVRDTLLKETG